MTQWYIGWPELLCVRPRHSSPRIVVTASIVSRSETARLLEERGLHPISAWQDLAGAVRLGSWGPVDNQILDPKHGTHGKRMEANER